MSYESDVAIQSLAFRPDGALEITFAEQRDITPKGTMMKCIVFDEGQFPRQVGEVQDDIRELIDLVLAEMRGGPPTIAGRIPQG